MQVECWVTFSTTVVVKNIGGGSSIILHYYYSETPWREEQFVLCCFIFFFVSLADKQSHQYVVLEVCNLKNAISYFIILDPFSC